MSKISTDEQPPRRNTINMRRTRAGRLIEVGGKRDGGRRSGIVLILLVRHDRDENQDDGVCDQSIFSFYCY